MDLEKSKSDSHSEIVTKVLPSLAEKLRGEGVISSYDRRPFMIQLFDDKPAFRINPDLVLYMPDERKVLIEVANPRDPKRFIGELLYPQILRTV